MHFPIKHKHTTLLHQLLPSLFYSRSSQLQALTHTMTSQKLTTLLLLLLCISFPFPITEATPFNNTDGEIKCGSCPCGDSCGQQLPLPSPPPPPPPSSPPLTYLSSQNCDPSPPPPPPSPRFIYVTGEPGNVYQTQPYNWGSYNSGSHNRDVGLLVLAGLVSLVIWVTSS